MQITVNNKIYQVNGNEFNTIIHNEYNNLNIKADSGKIDRICSLLQELKSDILNNIIIYNVTHGGYIPINIANVYNNVYLLNIEPKHKKNIEENISYHNVKNIKWEVDYEIMNKCIVFSEKVESINISFVEKYNPIIITPISAKTLKKIYTTIIELTDSNLAIYIPDEHKIHFYETFKYYIKSNNDGEQVLDYDNLINLCIMVKNGGEQFEQMLQKNMHLIDRWTILDTGSTDNTIEIIERTLIGKKRGNLYKEPFINFRDSRNRLLELAGESCKYILMLDDTYIICGDLRGFLNEVRGDEYADSFSLYIRSDDVEYGSNRILRADRHLKYWFKIHEVVQEENNINVFIPFQRSHIFDERFDYMERRTMDRKMFDLSLLQEEIDENPNNPRSYYYMAQTYNLLKDYDKAYKYFMIRANHPNERFIQEKIDAIFEGARCANFRLNKPWEECEKLYKWAYELDKSRPDSIYFLGMHYYLSEDKKTAYEYFKLAFEIGYPLHCQYSLKPTLSYHFLPKFLTQLCYEFNNYTLGEQCARLYLENNGENADQYQVIESWYNIFVKLNKMNDELTINIDETNEPILCFVADGGFEPWTGSDSLTKGIGGSETYIIEMSKYIQKSGFYKVLVFCNCLEKTVFENVEYIPISQFMPFAKTKFIHTCIVSRYSEYIPVAINGNVENLYMVVHDLTPSGLVIPLSDKLKNIFCLSEWHVEYFTSIFPQCKSITVPFYYGIDISTFDNEGTIVSNNDNNDEKTNIQMTMANSYPKTPYKFIYSSYPNRGLYELLLMWPTIVEKYPEANLHIYSDVNGKWVNDVAAELMQKIRDLYTKYENINGGLNVYKYGWVNKTTLAEAWKTSEYWLYPCTFKETFCLTALESALSKTLAITNGLAALQNTVGNRGICIEGDASSLNWRENALIELFSIMENQQRKEELLEKNYQWAKNMSWENQAHKLLDQYINENMLEYRGMYNWTHDLPKGINAKTRFEKAIEYHLKKNSNKNKKWVLEIGVYTGTSLIEIVRKIPNSFGLGIDRWENYNENNINILQNIEQNNIEKVFYRNVKIAKLEDRIHGIKGRSSDILLELVCKKMQYDFIYVDGSHKCFDVYLDLFLAWQLLRKGGVMAIDDYMYNVDKLGKQPYEYPYQAINQFLKDKKDHYTLIDMDYRVFLEKNI